MFNFSPLPKALRMAPFFCKKKKKATEWRIFNPKVNIMVTSKRLDERGFVSELFMFTLVFLIHEIQLKECNRHRTDMGTTLNKAHFLCYST